MLEGAIETVAGEGDTLPFSPYQGVIWIAGRGHDKVKAARTIGHTLSDLLLKVLTPNGLIGNDKQMTH
jgi:hypothetical protein